MDFLIKKGLGVWFEIFDGWKGDISGDGKEDAVLRMRLKREEAVAVFEVREENVGKNTINNVKQLTSTLFYLNSLVSEFWG